MALFNFGKKKEKKNAPACCCGSTEPKVEETVSCCCGSAPQTEETTSCCCDKSVDGICCIKVLGSGCKSCHALLEATKEAVKNMGLTIEVEYVTDMEKIMKYGAMSMPALVINEQIASMGKVLKAAEIEKLLRKYEV
ncbi:thioredoxin family protein [Enterocloster sp.]|jgi:small redox-active disulfide protein 2|uniref:thioredoxin family protein n=1 Tax=Enterocloster sp. TaxID=2719315 RepID=UPI003AB3CCF3